MKGALRVAVQNVHSRHYNARRVAFGLVARVRKSRRGAVRSRSGSMDERETEIEVDGTSMERNWEEEREEGEEGSWEGQDTDDVVQNEDGDGNGNGNAVILYPGPRVDLLPDTTVWDFLEFCSPPMTHLYEPLFNFGCTNGEYLSAMMTWPPSILWDVLQKFAWQGQVKMLDVEVLRYHLTLAHDDDEF